MSLYDLPTDKVIEILEWLDVPSLRVMAQVSHWFYTAITSRPMISEPRIVCTEYSWGQDNVKHVRHYLGEYQANEDEDADAQDRPQPIRLATCEVLEVTPSRRLHSKQCEKGGLTSVSFTFEEYGDESSYFFRQDELGRVQGNWRHFRYLSDWEKWGRNKEKTISHTSKRQHLEDGKLHGKCYERDSYDTDDEFGHPSLSICKWRYWQGLLHGKYYRQEFSRENSGPTEYRYTVRGFYSYGLRHGTWYIDDENRGMYIIAQYQKGYFHGKVIVTGKINYRDWPHHEGDFDIVRIELSFYNGYRHGPLIYSIIPRGTNEVKTIFESRYFWGYLETVKVDERRFIPGDWYGPEIDLEPFQQRIFSNFSLYIPHLGLC